MPFKSKAQQAFLFANHPDIAKKFAAETSKEMYKDLPSKKKKYHMDQMVSRAVAKYDK